MLGGLYGDLPPPSQSSAPAPSSAPAAGDTQHHNSHSQSQQLHKKPSSSSSSSSRAMAPVALRKAPGILAPPPSVLRNQIRASKPAMHASTPPPAKPPAADNDLLPPQQSSGNSNNHLVGASSSLLDEYDPVKPNDYEEYRRERKRKRMEEDVRRDVEKRNQEEEEQEKERQRGLERQRELEMNISGEEAWRRRSMLSRGGGSSSTNEVSRGGGSSSTNEVSYSSSSSEAAHQISGTQSSSSGKQQQSQGGMSAAQRMMARMGWKEGQGLGKQEQGITTPLVARKTDKRAGVIVNAAELKKQKPAAPAPTRVVLLRNMVGPGEVDAELEEEVASECSKYGAVTSVLIYEIIEQDYNPTEAVRIFIQFERAEQATKALNDLDGRFFGGRVVKGSYFDEERFARNELAPLPREHS